MDVGCKIGGGRQNIQYSTEISNFYDIGLDVL